MIVRMMTHELEVSILAAPLAQMDRGALSQAWLTALRMTPQAPIHGRRISPRAAPGLATRPASIPPPGTPGALHGPCSVVTRFHRRETSSGFDELCGVGARARRRTLAQRIERAFAGEPLRTKRATLSLGRGDARVHIILQTAGTRPMLLALCRPEMRAVVGAALAQARLALARRGIGVELCAVGERACS